MDLSRLQTNWQNLGRNDPLWAILSEPQAQGDKWDKDAFFATGRGVCTYLAHHLERLGVSIARARALDFGCGFGRLTQAIGDWFAEVVGVDIAESMLDGARLHNRHGDRVRYVRNDAADLRQFADGSFDFVLTLIVLQHMQPRYACGYLREFLRVLRPGGVLVFQLPAEPLALPPVTAARTAAADLLPLAALAGEVSVHPALLHARAGDWRWIQVRVRNRGRALWRAGDGPARMQVAWRFEEPNGVAGGRVTAVDLPHDVAPGEEARLLVCVRPPHHPGATTLAVRAVQGGRWHETPEWPTWRRTIEVAPAAAAAGAISQPPPPALSPFRAGAAAADEAHIEVYGTATAQIVELLEAAGGDVLEVGEDDWAGPDWLSSHYIVRKR